MFFPGNKWGSYIFFSINSGRAYSGWKSYGGMAASHSQLDHMPLHTLSILAYRILCSEVAVGSKSIFFGILSNPAGSCPPSYHKISPEFGGTHKNLHWTNLCSLQGFMLLSRDPTCGNTPSEQTIGNHSQTSPLGDTQGLDPTVICHMLHFCLASHRRTLLGFCLHRERMGTRSSSVFLYRHPFSVGCASQDSYPVHKQVTQFSLPFQCCHHKNFQQLMNDAQQLQLYSSLIHAAKP